MSILTENNGKEIVLSDDDKCRISDEQAFVTKEQNETNTIRMEMVWQYRFLRGSNLGLEDILQQLFLNDDSSGRHSEYRNIDGPMTHDLETHWWFPSITARICLYF